MDDRSSRKKRPRDMNALAAAVVAELTGQAEPEEPSTETQPEPTAEERHAAAVTLGRLGGKKGGKARAEKLTPEQRKETARKAARVRWSHKIT